MTWLREREQHRAIAATVATFPVILYVVNFVFWFVMQNLLGVPADRQSPLTLRANSVFQSVGW